jgi:rhodanese-related sulfurtransferase
MAAAAFTFAVASHAGDTPPTPRIDQASLLKRIEKKDASLVILDVRTPEEYAAGHVPGAINIPYTHLPSRISEVADAADKDIVVYCTVGVRAEKGAERLRENGFTKLLHLDGDMKAWEAQKRPLEK